MNRFGDSNCRGDQGQGATETIAAGRSYGRQLPKMAAVVTALLALGGCSWFSNDEPAFPPSSGGPNIAAVPNGLPGDSGNAEYSDQELRALLGSAPRPLPPAPAAPKAADTGTPDNAAPADNAPTASTAPANGQPAAAPAPAGTVPAAPVPDATSNNANGYPDINTVPMQRPTPVPEPDAATPNTTAPDATTPSTTPTDKPKQSSMLMPGEAGTAKLEKLQVLTTAGSSPAAPTDLVTQTAQSTGTGDDAMFSKPALPPYTGYDQTQKQQQAVPSQALYHSPYGAGGQPVAGTDGSVYYASQPGASAQAALSPAGQQVGLVYFGIGS
ncbi:MAG TPA: hypothetical protein VN229_08615, partial [Terriglobales bacterium]|nr:hypothetical protein [Terriglobales bacterium]